VKAPDREFVVDRLRGYALLGIILVNAPFLLTSSNGFTDISAPTLGDQIAWFSVAAFFQAKSYVIFSFLFGYSLAIFLRGVERRGQPATRLYLRRLGGLFLFGAAHLWLHRFAIGPAESILRAITYRRRPRLPRLVPPPVEAEPA